jgi:hypothetical protein
VPDSKRAKTEYFRVQNAWVLDKFTQEEIALFFKEGRQFFTYLKKSTRSNQYLIDHPEFAEVLKKW